MRCPLDCTIAGTGLPHPGEQQFAALSISDMSVATRLSEWYIFAMAKLSEILRERGYVNQHSSETLEEITDGPKRTVYLGVDPTADSIHVGNLVVYMLLRHFADAGHKIILIVGGGTGLALDAGFDQ